MKVYIEPRDWWIGYYRGDEHNYVCPLPCVVVRWKRRPPHWVRRIGPIDFAAGKPPGPVVPSTEGGQ